MSVGVLPEDGEDLSFSAGLAGPGRRHRSQGRPVTWITDRTQASAGTTWARLSEKAAQTGLQPFLLADMAGEPGRPWGTPESDRDEVISAPLDIAAIGPLDAAAVGIAPAIVGELDPELMRRAPYQHTRAARIARIGLVPAQRPADVLAGLGWQGGVNSRLTADITAVLRSWGGPVRRATARGGSSRHPAAHQQAAAHHGNGAADRRGALRVQRGGPRRPPGR